MKAASVELVPRAFLTVVFGVVFWISVRSTAPILSSLSAVNAVTAIGTLSRVSDRRRAVTTISAGASLLAVVSSTAGCAAGVSCAKAGLLNNAAAAAPI